MGSYYANYTTGADANPGTIIAPKKNITGASGLISIPHGTADSSQPSRLNLARDSVWPRQRLLPTTGQQASSLLNIGEYGSGSVRPTIDFEHTEPGTYIPVVVISSYTTISDMRVINVGPDVGGSTVVGSRGFSTASKQNVAYVNCEVDYCTEGAFHFRECGGTVTITGCLARLVNMSSFSPPIDNWGAPMVVVLSPDILSGTGSAQMSDNVVDRGYGEGQAVVQSKNVAVSGGLVFSCRSAQQYLNCVLNCSIERMISYGTTDTTWHRNTGTVGYGIGTFVETATNTPGNDSRAPSHDNIVIKLNMVAFTNRGITISAGNVNTKNPYKMNIDQNTVVDNNFNIAMINNQGASSGSTFWNNASLVYASGGASHSEATIDVPTGLNINYTNWIGVLSSRQAALIGANDATTPFQIVKQSGWRSLNDVYDLGLWTITNRVLSNDAQADNFQPLSLASTVQALAHPALDWYGFAGLTNPGAIRFQPEEAPITEQGVRVERFQVDFGATADTYSLVFAQAGKDAASVWPHLCNTRHASAGFTAGTTAVMVEEDLGITIENIGAAGCTLRRHASSGAANVRVTVEVWFYDGPTGGPNEFIVRWSGTKTITGTASTTTQAISGVVDAGDLVAECLGSIAAVNEAQWLLARASLSGTSTLTFTRDTGGTEDVTVAGLVVELTGTNWDVQEVTHTFSAFNTTETEAISSVTSWSTAFIVQSYTAPNDSPAELGCLVWPGSTTSQLRLRVETDTIGLFGVTTAFIVRNPELSVDHYDSITGGQSAIGTATAPANQYLTITAVPDLTLAGVIMQSLWNEHGFNGSPDCWFNYQLSAVNQLNIWRARSNVAVASQWAAQVIDFSAMTEEVPDEQPSEQTRRSVDRSFFFKGFRR